MIAGHVHAYERTTPVYNYNVNLCGSVHITIGVCNLSLPTPYFAQLCAYGALSFQYAATLQCLCDQVLPSSSAQECGHECSQQCI